MTAEVLLKPAIQEGESRFKILFIDLDTSNTDQASLVVPQMGWKSRALDSLRHLVIDKIKTQETERIYRQTTEQDKEGKEKKAEWRWLSLPENPSVFAGIMIGGSGLTVRRTGPEESVVWRNKLESYLRQAIQEGVPVLGICAGAQILARACGGDVARMRKTLPDGRDVADKEIGCCQIQRASGSKDDPLFQGLPVAFFAHENHEDIITRLPEKAQLLAVNERGVQAFRIGNAWGVQFHPERAMVRTKHFLEKGRDGLQEKGYDVDQLLRELQETPEAARILTNFLNFALQKMN